MLKWLPKLPVIFHNITWFSPVSPYVNPSYHWSATFQLFKIVFFSPCTYHAETMQISKRPTQWPCQPSDHARSAVGLHDCFYRGAKTGNLKIREQLAIELNIFRRSAIRPTIRSATFARRYEPRTRSLSPTGPQWRTTTDSVLSGFLAVLLSARFEFRNTGRRSPSAHQLQSPFYRQPSLQQLHRSHNKRWVRGPC